MAGALSRKNLMVDNDAIVALARLRGTNESEAVRQAVAEALDDDAFNAASRRFFSNRALRKTFSDEAHLAAVYGHEMARLTRPDVPATPVRNRPRRRRAPTPSDPAA